MNTDALEFALLKAERRVLEMQTKLHCWRPSIVIAGSLNTLIEQFADGADVTAMLLLRRRLREDLRPTRPAPG
ncbi:hypothetical protein QMK19_35640 [Streptomyces sp. H10-C2]|uniref:hypothetical protein n=1 Tax=unclassified Streptomyces TaxID=2593676 RepID=UPI0024B89F47|nr:MULTISPECIES: hypothetical protein [unclassified Streptomyces]MDJ0346428.1 hypothetical protein [Streptomyces sp. PH10-H1]MDJ0374814.1 hypothetical protein [Streptomyces sp. H10-C2]